MLSWKVEIQPRWTNPSEIKRRIGIFKRYAKDALVVAKPQFKRNLRRRTNKSTGTHIKSRRISALEPTLDIQEQNEFINITLSLVSSSTELNYIMLALEEGATVLPRRRKVLTVPKGLNQAMAGKATSFTEARWVRLYNSKKLVLATGKWGHDFKILYWGKYSVTIPPKKYFEATARDTVIYLSNRFPRALNVAWSNTWTAV